MKSERSRFIQLIKEASLGKLSEISKQTSDSWKLEQLSMCKYPSVRADAVGNEYIGRGALKICINYGAMPILHKEGPEEYVDIGMVYSGLANPIIFRSENLKFFEELLDYVLAKNDPLFMQAITKNPAASGEYLVRMYEKEMGHYEFGRKDPDVLMGIIAHPNTPISIKIKYASSSGTNFQDERLRNAAKQSLRDSKESDLR